ncbi:MAG: hypothetical protein QOF71_2956 [Candidatus Eremiobacteraeota bacterium]|jgi:hypothetical protein|nr:hypothetical protein [Candidatus Eremiobacteraeota bacterium]
MHDHDHDHAQHEHEHEHEHEHGGHEHGGHEHEHHHHHEEDERFGATGKVVGLIYDRTGAFDGFLLDTEDGERAFDSREPGIEDVAGRAWAERILTTVYADAAEPWRPVRIVLRA